MTGFIGGNAADLPIQEHGALLICTFIAPYFQVKPAT